MSDEPPGPEIAVSILDAAWRDAVGDPESVCRKVAAAALGAGSADWAVDVARLEVSLALADDATVRSLNSEYRGQDKPTNVLSFPALEPDSPLPSEGPLLLGDVIVAYETTIGEAAAEGKTVANHLSHLVVHGVLHLLGHDHEEDFEAERMERLETAVLSALGVPDPYATEAEAPAEGR